MKRILLPLLLLALLAVPRSSQAQEPSQPEAQQLEASSKPDPRETARAIRENIMLFGEIYRQISLRYVDHVDPKEFLKAGIDGMLGTLDPYTEYMEMEQSDELRIMSQGRYGGVGIRISTRGPERVLTVVAPMEGTPAWRRGIRAGDQILFIDDESTEGFSTSDAADRMRGEPDTEVTLKIRRAGVDELLEYVITRQVITVHDVSFSGLLEEGIGYIRLTRFSRNSGEDVRKAVGDLLAEKADLNGLILDLRSNPGGLLPEAVNVAENFVAAGDPIVATRGRNGEQEMQYHSEASPSLPLDIPLVVMINEGSASASEIVAGAVQDLDRGVLVGKTSFGKGLVQSAINFRNNSILKMTTAKYYTPSGRLIQKIDYFSENDALLNPYEEVVEDSLYETASGREVVAHGGIQPDVIVEMPDVGELTLALWRKDLFYGYANHVREQEPDLESWQIDGQRLEDFRSYMEEQEFSFETETERHVKAIREHVEERGASEALLKELADLEQQAELEKATLFTQEEQQIRERLSVELASAIGGMSARSRAALEFDPQAKRALELLRQDGEYADIRLGMLQEISE